MSPQTRIAQVILDTRLPQLDRPFDYAIPESLDVAVGSLVKVPLRQRKTAAQGYVVGLSDSTDHTGTLAEIAEVVSPVGLLAPQIYALAEAIAERQAGSTSDVVRLAVPPRYVRTEKKWWDKRGEDPTSPALSGPLAEVDGFSDDSWGAMLKPSSRTALYLPHGGEIGSRGRWLPRSSAVVARLAQTAYAAGQSLIVVVPTWRHMELYEERLRDALPEGALLSLHAELAPAERYRNFLECLEPRARVVIGTRHAVYAPVHNLSGVVVLDDGDESHCEPLAPYPHTRDIALLRGSLEGCAVVFASLVPSLSVTRWVEQGYVEAVAPTNSHRAQVIPTELALGDGGEHAPARLPSQAFRGAKEALKTGPVLVQVFRTGFAPGVSCAECREKSFCRSCSGPLRVPQGAGKPTCLWCGVSDSTWRCALCGHGSFLPRGHGIERTLSDIGKSFPGVPLVRADGQHRVARVPNTPALVIATRGAEPLADHGYRAALLLDGAAMLSRESIGALEDSLQAWESAIALLADDGTGFLTDVSGQPALAVSSGRYETLLRHEIDQRHVLRMPPSTRIASLSGPASVVKPAQEALEATGGLIDVLGPVAIDGGIRVIARFSYAEGARVTRELRAVRQKLSVARSRNQPGVLRVVVDNPDRLDALLRESD